MLKQRTLPPEYLQQYIEAQEHFSLKRFVENCLKRAALSPQPLRKQGSNNLAGGRRLQGSQRSLPTSAPVPGTVPAAAAPMPPQQHSNRYVAFTRTTPDLVRLPNNAENLVYSNPGVVTLLEVASYGTEDACLLDLDNFGKSKAALCLILVDLYVCSKRMVNRVRQMVEDQALVLNKVFLVLLHFPPGWYVLLFILL